VTKLWYNQLEVAWTQNRPEERQVFYQNGDDPQFLSDLRTALRRWHKPALGDTPLALRLTSVKQHQAADPRLSRSAALRETVRAGLARLRAEGSTAHANLLEQRYLQEQSVYLLQGTYHLSERSLYYRLDEALRSLAHALWSAEQVGSELAVPSSSSIRIPANQWRARHLPAPTYTRLFGVDRMLALLLDGLNDPVGHWLISLDGMGGLGKTALAREVVGRLAGTERFADIAWLTVKPEAYYPQHVSRPEQTVLSCDEVLDAIACQLDDLDVQSLTSAAKRDQVHTLLHTHPYLVVVDNLEVIVDCGGVPDLLWELANPSKFLLTSRYRINPDTCPSSVLTVHELADLDSLAFIRHEGQLRGLQELEEAGDDVLHSILAVTGGNPLAIKLVVGQLVNLPLSRVLATLQSAQPASDPLYNYLYCTTWDLLSATAQRLLLHMALVPASGGTWEDLAAVTSLPEPELAAAIGELATCSLLQVAGLEEKTYSIHPLTRHFVVSQATRQPGIEV
jgi:hypothetical protein